MTYKELTDGIIRLWKENARLMDVVALIDGYFLGVQQRSGGDKKFEKNEIEVTIRLLLHEASKWIREENQLGFCDKRLHDKIGITSFVILNLIDSMRDAGIISIKYRDSWLKDLVPLQDRAKEYYLELLVDEENRMERAKVSRGRRSLNLKLKQEYAGKKEDELVVAVLEFIGAAKGMAERKTMRCFLFGGEDDGLLLGVTKARPLAWLLRTLRGMGIYALPKNIYQVADGWFSKLNGEKVKDYKGAAKKYDDDPAQAKQRADMIEELSALISRN